VCVEGCGGWQHSAGKGYPGATCDVKRMRKKGGENVGDRHKPIVCEGKESRAVAVKLVLIHAKKRSKGERAQ